jgi:hypothetical protein
MCLLLRNPYTGCPGTRASSSSQPRNLLSIARLNSAGSRLQSSICIRIDQTARSRGWLSTAVAVRVDDVAPNGYAMDRATIRQKKTGRPVRFELTAQPRPGIDEYLRLTGRKAGQFLFVGRADDSRGLTTRQYAPLVRESVTSIGLDPSKFGTHIFR